MLVIGARFRTFAAARAALRAVRASVPVPSGDVDVRALGSTRYDAPEDRFLLAGRFEADDAPAVTAIVHAQGGQIIERRKVIERDAASAAAPTVPMRRRGSQASAAARARRFGSGRHGVARRRRDTSAPVAR